jgi:hypothetical protein
MATPVIEARHGLAGARRGVGGCGGHVGGPHIDQGTVTVTSLERALSLARTLVSCAVTAYR